MPCRATTKHESHTPLRTHALRATPPVRAMPHAPRTRYASSPSQHPRPRKRAMPRTLLLMRLKRPSHYTPSTFWEESASLHNQNITYYNITCNVYPNRSKDYTKKRGNLFLYRLNLLSLHDESWTTDSHCQNMHKQRFIRHQIFWHQHPCQSVGNNKRQVQLNRKSSWV